MWYILYQTLRELILSCPSPFVYSHVTGGVAGISPDSRVVSVFIHIQILSENRVNTSGFPLAHLRISDTN